MALFEARLNQVIIPLWRLNSAVDIQPPAFKESVAGPPHNRALFLLAVKPFEFPFFCKAPRLPVEMG